MEVDQKKTGGDMKVECKLRSGGDMPTPRTYYYYKNPFVCQQPSGVQYQS